MMPSETVYLLESRYGFGEGGEHTIHAIGKTVQLRAVPFWAYIGAMSIYDDKTVTDACYGAGVPFNIREALYTSATLERDLVGSWRLTCYSTVPLGDNFFVDFHPSLVSDGPPDITFNVGGSFGNFTVGASHYAQHEAPLRVQDTDLRINIGKKGRFTDFAFNFGKRKVRVARQWRFK